MLVYLDTSHFSQLTDTAPRSVVQAFFDTWERAECQLAFSVAHLKEIAQLSDIASRERRISMLERFEGIRFCPEVSVQLMIEEVKHQFEARSHARSSDVFALRHRLFPRSDVREVCKLLAVADEVIPDIRRINELYAELDGAAREMKPFLDELLEITDGKPLADELPPEVTRPSREDLEAARATVRHPELAPVKAMYGPVKRERKRRRGASLPDWFYEAAPSLSYLKLLDEPGIARRRFPEDDVEIAAFFYRMAIEELGIERRESSLLATPWSIVTNEMDPYESPGWNLLMAIMRGLRSAPKPAEASDPVDWEHAFHLPYVDLAFVDKRIMGHIHDQSRRDGYRLARDAVSHIRFAGDLNAVIMEIRAATGT